MMKLRNEQVDGLNALWYYFMNGGTGNPLLAWPTGFGKSLVPAYFIKMLLRIYPNLRFMLLTHVKELIQQNADELKNLWPTAPLGIYSAGLKLKEHSAPIVYAGIASAIKNPAIFGHRDIIFVDEAHMISQNDTSMYQTFFAILKLINPKLVVIGLSATCFRMGQGYITDGGLFTDIVHDLCSMENFNKLLDKGYLSPLIPKRVDTEFDISNVGIQNGEYINTQLEEAVNKQEKTYKALQEMIKFGHDRKSWLIFASGVKHAEEIASTLTMLGIDCAPVHSKRDPDYNDAAIKAFKRYELRAIVNYGKLTTGFNHPGIDLIGMLRWTLSVPLWVQMLGRGTRPCEGKENCLVLDFARNTPRLGPINDPVIPVKRGGKPGDAPVKLCDHCGAYNHARAAFCCDCGAEFKFKSNLVSTAGTHELIKKVEEEIPVIENFEVNMSFHSMKQKKDKVTKIALGAPYIVATYFCANGKKFTENVFPEHTGYARQRFKQWWHQRHPSDPPETVQEALKLVSQLRCPKRISVHVNKKYPDVTGCEF